jgi:hypothetical protein
LTNDASRITIYAGPEGVAAVGVLDDKVRHPPILRLHPFQELMLAAFQIFEGAGRKVKEKEATTKIVGIHF